MFAGPESSDITWLRSLSQISSPVEQGILSVSGCNVGSMLAITGQKCDKRVLTTNEIGSCGHKA